MSDNQGRPAEIKTSPGVQLTSQQNNVVGNVLQLFAGYATKNDLGLWTDDAVFEDPIALAEGRQQYEAQWYGLKAAFSEIERKHFQVIDSGNPIKMELETRYVVKGIGKEQLIKSVVEIHTTPDGSKITKVADKWDGKLPDSSIKNAFRRLNAKTMPHVVSVPKDSVEEQKKEL
ncbi:hypothetical protein BT63DRAFT_420098 [Microthyrium microscopicum]|uniref:SnoaL-like domain-containing protein n=1 Tax=Microthyrium microscopicum TaxID=703497 RepID=A0A6A6UTQ5_9PEZI|nr:hypothetical protein BT63DRAFT_420098 [Microthyrium microscopicum]